MQDGGDIALFNHQPISRRTALAGGAAVALVAARNSAAFADDLEQKLHRQYEPLKLRRIELLRHRKLLYVRATAGDAVGIAVANQNRLLDIQSLLTRRVAPEFLGQDVRRLPALVDEVYVANSNYKFAGMPFWNAVAHLELAILDLLGRLAKLPAGQVVGKVRRNKIPVYISRFDRNTTAEIAVATAADALDQTGAKAVKLKVGLRMRTSDEQTQRDIKMVNLARERLGDDVQINVDANGSYTAKQAIEIGKTFAASGVGFFEEPCRWEDYDATRAVTAALDLTIAGGEQDSSWPRWKSMMARRTVDLLQPDVFYNGGIIRALRLAKLAEEAGLLVTPHSPKTGVEALANLQLVSIIPNLGPFQEYRESPDVRDGFVSVPNAPGLGIDYEPKEWRAAEVLWAAG